LSYRVAEDRDDKVTQLFVTDSGEVELPLGSLRVKASGKTTPQLAADIKGVLEREYYKPGHATVFLGLVSAAPNASRGKVYLTGEIASKGAIDLPADGQLTVYQAILQLGGFTQDANLKAVFIYRKGGPAKGLQIDCKAISNGDTAKDVVLQPGDTVKVKKKLFDWQM
ncbi:MAG: SLBB domain-containing protein, partial [Rhodospirillales bacterium]|nr:SLBB domain-containing protein [Acetobacter sp.]